MSDYWVGVLCGLAVQLAAMIVLGICAVAKIAELRANLMDAEARMEHWRAEARKVAQPERGLWGGRAAELARIAEVERLHGAREAPRAPSQVEGEKSKVDGGGR